MTPIEADSKNMVRDVNLRLFDLERLLRSEIKRLEDKITALTARVTALEV